MKKSLTFVTIFICLFSFLNVKSVNTIDSMVLMYERDNLFEEDIFNINFFSFNVKEIPEVFKDLDIEIISVKPIEDLYESDDLSERGNSFKEITSNLINRYTNNLIKKGYEEEALYYEQQGFNIQSMKIRCLIKDLIILESRVKII